MSAATLPADGTLVRVKRVGPLPGQSSMPGVPAGTPAIVRHVSPSGLSNYDSGLVWLELDGPIIWSHGVSDHCGFWASPAEFELEHEAEPSWPGMPDPHRHNPFAVAVVLAVIFGLAWTAWSALVVIMIAKVGP